MMQQPSPERRRRNIRLAIILAVFAVAMMVSSIPFWKGLLNVLTNAPQ